MHQPSLPLPIPQSYAPEDFVVSDSNRAAYHLLTSPLLSSANPITAITGAQGAGKTHLMHVLCQQQKTLLLPLSHIGDEPADSLTKQHSVIAIDDVHTLKNVSEKHPDLLASLAQLINAVRAENTRLILFSRIAPARLDAPLDDLTSRLKAIPEIALLPPDDFLLHALLYKYFTDRQLRVGDDIIPYILSRMERTTLAAQTIVSEIDARSMQYKREITLPLVRQTLNDIAIMPVLYNCSN